MLLEFTARNYKSFKDELRLSMLPESEETALDYSVMTEQAAGETYQALCSTVIYGPNASGKTNVISALDTFRRIVLRGNIDDTEDDAGTYNPAALALNLIPNNTQDKPRPIEFSVRFFTKGVLIDYAFSADIGDFLQEDCDRKVLSETLSVNNVLIFIRENGVEVSAESLEKFPEFFEANIPASLPAIRTLPGWNVEPRQLFLNVGFPSLLSPILHKIIIEWLSRRLLTACRSDTLSFAPNMPAELNENDYPLFADGLMNDAVSRIGTQNLLGYAYNPQVKETLLASALQRKNKNLLVPAEIFESYGTYRLANLFPFLESAFLNGSTLVLDEFDASLHPMVLMNIINLFHDDEINRNHAQLIFNTHNPIFLDRSLFRRDEIKFVERDEETQSSELYALSDFEPESGRDYEDYLGNYFRNRYGAIQYVDLAPVFRKMMEENEKKSGEG